MEAQPIALVLLFMPILFLDVLPSGPMLDMGAIVLILAGLHWWALFTHALTERGGNEHLIRSLQLTGLALAGIVVCGLQLFMGNTISDLIIPCLVVIWGWRRGNLWARKEVHDEQLILTFKIGFITIVAILLITILRYVQTSTDGGITVPKDYIFTALAQALPLFFLASLVALSFSRLEMIRKDSKRNVLGDSRLDPTRNWRLILLLAWLVLIAMCIALETFALTPLSILFTPVWNLALAILDLILYVLFAALSLLVKPVLSFVTVPRSFRQLPIPSPSKAHSANNPGIPPAVTIIMLLILTCIVLVLAFLIIRAVLRQRRHTWDEEEMNEEEERESLSLNDILQARRERREQRRQDAIDALLDPLDPASARARYRELLQTAASSQANLARRTYETPYEYQRRLASLLGSVPLEETTAQAGEATPPGPAILAELTDAYVRERYGDKPLDQPQRSYLGRWIPDLLRRLVGAGSLQQTSAPHARLPNKWGD